MSTQNPITQSGMMENHLGHFVPVEKIPAIDLMRDKLVGELVASAKSVSAAISQFRGQAFDDIAAFVSLSAEEYGVKIGGGKGNVTLCSFDGKYKVQRAVAEHIAFDERLQAAKALVNECIQDWSQGSSPEIRALVNDAFQVDKEGNINLSRVLMLRRLEISDERWSRAMKAISDAIQVVGSKSYIRIYERDENGEYIAIPLGVAKG